MFGPRNRTWVAKTVYAQEKKREAKEGARPMTFDWSFVQRYAPFFVNGTLMTLFISVFGILLAIAVGLVCAGVEIARIPVARQIVRIYIELSRNTPLLVQLYFLYFGLPKLGVVWSAETCAIVGLGFLGVLHGRGNARRIGSGAQRAARNRVRAGTDFHANHHPSHSAASSVHRHSRRSGQCDLPV